MPGGGYPLRLSPPPTHLSDRHLRLATSLTSPAGVVMKRIDGSALTRLAKAHALTFRRKGNEDLRGFGFAFGTLALLDLQRDFIWLISLNDSRIAKAVDEPLNAKIIGIEEAFTDADNAQMNAACTAFFAFILCQCPCARIAFHDGQRMGIVRRMVWHWVEVGMG